MKHFEFTDKTKTFSDGTILKQIRATKDLPIYNVKKGDVGGWIEKEENLSENAWVSGNAHIFGNARVSGNAWVSGYAWLYGNTKVSGNEIINTGNYNKGNKK